MAGLSACLASNPVDVVSISASQWQPPTLLTLGADPDDGPEAADHRPAQLGPHPADLLHISHQVMGTSTGTGTGPQLGVGEMSRGPYRRCISPDF